MSKLKRIQMTDIVPSPVALRTVDEESDKFLELVDSIANVGVLNPINVRPKVDEPGKYVLIDGLHRFRATQRAGVAEIPAQILDMDDGQAQEAQLIANYHKVDTKPVEYATQLRKILASHPLMTMAELASKINVSPAWLAERFKLLKYSDDIKTMIDTGQIGLSNAFVMSRLPESEVPNFIDRAMTQSPEEFAAAVKERVAEVNQARREGRDVKEEEFVPHAKIRKAGEIKEALDNPRFLSELIVNKGITDPAEAAIYSIKWICSLDDESVAVSRAKWEARKNDLEEAKARRKAERDAKKAKEAADKAAEITEDTNIV